MRWFWCVAWMWAVWICALTAMAQEDAVSRAVAALQQGDLSSAEQILRTELKERPNNTDALDVLGVVLDQEKKYTDADAVYRRAVAASPRSPSVLNNYGNHLVATGKLKEARAAFLQVLALKPDEVNACSQLARIALERKTPAEATTCLDRLPAGAQDRPDIGILRMQVDYAVGRNREATALLARVSRSADKDARLSFSLGVALSAVGQYEKAETFFSRALEAAPENFEALYDLGLAASRAGHKERARDVLQQALEQQPENVDVLYDLAAVNAELGKKEAALALLARAARLAPDRADIQRLIAHTSADLGDFADAVGAWKRYMILMPADDVGRREHAFAETALGENSSGGIADLQWYVRAHPNDAIGHYELGTAESPTNTDEAMKELNRALTLKPDLLATHVARGLLNYRLGNPASALSDFEFAAQHDSANPRILDRLGETYMALDRPTDALRAFRHAAELAPRDSTILMHLGRALANAGQTEEAKTVFARFRELGPSQAVLPYPAGLVDFLTLSPEEQYARYRAGVERTVQKDPNNPEAEVRYLGLLLDDRKTGEAETVARKILALKPRAILLADAASELLAAEQYSTAYGFLQQAGSLAGASRGLELDFAIATFHVKGPQAGLEQMDHIPQTEREGDYYLARMQILEALGQVQDAASALKQALDAKPARPELYRQAALLLLKKQRTADALRLLEKGARILPNDPDISLLRAIAAESNANPQDSERLLTDFANRWPESSKVWSQTR